MKRYLVGGAVRDALLGLPVTERDWVVVGATPEQMIEAGYQPVGKDFPVFLHPETKEEHALARTERKSGRGYHGFTFHTGAEVTLEDDLARRDLTVNAIAQDENGALIDPHGGQTDLDARVLRHVSPAFAEDPVRVLRLARFAARFAPLGFRIAPETLALMRQMVADGEVDALVPERVWQETARALMLERPSVYFETLRACGALVRVMPELGALFGVPQPPKHHPEIDSGLHTLMTLDAAARAGASLAVRATLVCHDFGKALTPPEILPGHAGHESRGLAPIKTFCERLRVPAAIRELALMVCRDHLNVHRALELRPATLLDLLERLDALRRPERFEEALLACTCDFRGRSGNADREYPSADYLRAAAAVATSVQARELIAEGYSGAAVGEKLRERRVKALKRWRASGAGVGEQ